MDFLKKLENIMTQLRSKNGCPWDKKQTHKSLKPYLLEEAHEVIEAINEGKPALLEEELGDLLLQVVFHSQLAKEKGQFDLQGVAKTICDKLIRRHPHVFGKSSRKISDINRKWEELKRQEKPERKSPLDGLPKSLPALLRAQRIFEKTHYRDRTTRSKQLKELELTWKNFKKGLQGAKIKKETAFGDLLLILAKLANQEGIHAEMALRTASSRLENNIRENHKKSIE